ncbi:MAG: hypothetical protein OXH47_09030 [Paracoccaceae bacterium]|nr:hypothetical protein [Paracoccaceae bacterium]
MTTLPAFANKSGMTLATVGGLFDWAWTPPAEVTHRKRTKRTGFSQRRCLRQGRLPPPSIIIASVA